MYYFTIYGLSVSKHVKEKLKNEKNTLKEFNIVSNWVPYNYKLAKK